jgi:endonuclease-3 related protein
MGKQSLMIIYSRLNKRFGFLNWWPADSKFEIIIGAILTQQASWKNVEKAIFNMKKEHILDIDAVYGVKTEVLENIIKPSGFYKQKAKRIKAFVEHVKNQHGTLENMLVQNSNKLRKELLSLNGIGKETADSIMLYAAGKPIFVIDAYTKRIMKRIYKIEKEMDYDSLQDSITSKIPKNIKLYKDFHAQFVELGKNYCKSTPKCTECPIKTLCKHSVEH